MQDKIQDQTEKGEFDPLLEEFIKSERELSNKLKGFLGMIKKSEDSKYRVTNYLLLLDNLSKRFRID